MRDCVLKKPSTVPCTPDRRAPAQCCLLQVQVVCEKGSRDQVIDSVRTRFNFTGNRARAYLQGTEGVATPPAYSSGGQSQQTADFQSPPSYDDSQRTSPHNGSSPYAGQGQARQPSSQPNFATVNVDGEGLVARAVALGYLPRPLPRPLP